MGAQGSGQLVQGAEQPREDAGVHPQHGVGGVRHVEPHVPVVGVHHRLHGVPDVVERTCRLAVRVTVAGGVRVHHPEHAALGHHRVGIPVVPEERRQAPDPLGHRAGEQDPAVRGEVRGEQDAPVAEAGGEGHAPQPAAQGDPRPALVAAGHVLVAPGVVELFHPGADDHVVAGQLAEVDLRAVQPQLRELRAGRDVPQPQLRQALLRDPVHGGRHHAVTVGVDEVLVHPRAGLRRQAGGVQLPHRQHELLLAPPDRVAVDVHVGEGVVRPQALQLAESLQQGPVVPQAHVVQGGPLPLDGRGVQPVLGFEGHEPHPVEPVRPEGGLDVRPEVGGLAVEFRGCDHQLLDQGRYHPHAHEPRRHHHRQDAGREAEGPQPHVQEQQRRAHCREGSEELQRRQPGVGVRVGDPEHQTPLGGEQLVRVQPEPRGPDQEEQPGHQGQVRPRSWRQPQQAPQAQTGRGGHQVYRQHARAGHEQPAPQQVLQEPPEGKPEQVEGNIQAEHRVLFPRGRGVQELLERHPLPGAGEPREDSHHRAAQPQPPPQARAGDVPGAVKPQLHARRRRQGPQGHPQVQVQDRPHHRGHEGEQGRPG
ncbi:hypothetical protein HRbin31_00736 [bacterium HR31]|nr:hypothetical protein HRbin31_00736 [bacterium HR31]